MLRERLSASTEGRSATTEGLVVKRTPMAALKDVVVFMAGTLAEIGHKC